MLAPRCFVCDREEAEHEIFTEVEDGYICPECSGEYAGEYFGDLAPATAVAGDLEDEEMDIDY